MRVYQPTRTRTRANAGARFKVRHGQAFALSALALLALALAPVGGARVHAGPLGDPHASSFSALFGTREIHSTNLAAFPKWTRVLERHASEAAGAARPCTSVGFFRCIGGKDWTRFLASLEGKDKRVQIEEVSRYVNRAPYLSDQENYGSRDYWATPMELFARGGDCEDYVIAKFLGLRSLGFSNRDMRLVVLQDLDLGRPHAVLVVRVDNQVLVLDNQISRVVPEDRFDHYRPFYSVNEEHWWLHLA